MWKKVYILYEWTLFSRRLILWVFSLYNVTNASSWTRNQIYLNSSKKITATWSLTIHNVPRVWTCNPVSFSTSPTFCSTDYIVFACLASTSTALFPIDLLSTWPRSFLSVEPLRSCSLLLMLHLVILYLLLRFPLRHSRNLLASNHITPYLFRSHIKEKPWNFSMMGLHSIFTITSRFGKTRAAHVNRLLNEFSSRSATITGRFLRHQTCLTSLKAFVSCRPKTQPTTLRRPKAQ